MLSNQIPLPDPLEATTDSDSGDEVETAVDVVQPKHLKESLALRCLSLRLAVLVSVCLFVCLVYSSTMFSPQHLLKGIFRSHVPVCTFDCLCLSVTSTGSRN